MTIQYLSCFFFRYTLQQNPMNIFTPYCITKFGCSKIGLTADLVIAIVMSEKLFLGWSNKFWAITISSQSFKEDVGFPLHNTNAVGDHNRLLQPADHPIQSISCQLLLAHPEPHPPPFRKIKGYKGMLLTLVPKQTPKNTDKKKHAKSKSSPTQSSIWIHFSPRCFTVISYPSTVMKRSHTYRFPNGPRHLSGKLRLYLAHLMVFRGSIGFSGTLGSFRVGEMAWLSASGGRATT